METRDKIIQSSVELFGVKGYHSTSLQEISDNAGVSKGAVFHYFPNKSEILYEIHDSFIDRILEQAMAVINRDDLDASQKLRDLILDLVQLIADFKPYVVVFFQELKNVPEDKMLLIKAKRDEYEKIFQAVVEQGVDNGVFRNDLNIDITVKAIFGMCDWTHMWMNPKGFFIPRQIGLMFWKILNEGLKKENGF